MPINIYEQKTHKEVAYLADSYWDLPNQIAELEEWLKETNTLSGTYVADIGFDIRPDASGGGAVLTLDMLKKLSELGIEIYLSEYPGSHGS